MKKMNLFGNKRRILPEEFDTSYTGMKECFSSFDKEVNSYNDWMQEKSETAEKSKAEESKAAKVEESKEPDVPYTATSEMFSKMRPSICWISCTLEDLGLSNPAHEDFLLELGYEDTREEDKNKINAKTGKHFEWFKETSGNGNWVLYNTEMYEVIHLNGELTLHYKECCSLTPFPPLNISSCKSMFESCTSLESLDLSNFDFKVIERADYMFYDCKNLKSIITENSNDKINGYCMFYGCESLPGFNPDHIDGYMAKSVGVGGYLTLAKHD